MEKELASRIYNQTITDLHTQIKNHHSPQPDGTTKTGIAAFAEAYGLSRQNLQKTFALGQNSLSVGVYIRILVGLGILDKSYLQGTDATEFTLSLKLYLQLNHNLLLSSVMAVRNATLPEPAAHV